MNMDVIDYYLDKQDEPELSWYYKCNDCGTEYDKVNHDLKTAPNPSGIAQYVCHCGGALALRKRGRASNKLNSEYLKLNDVHSSGWIKFSYRPTPEDEWTTILLSKDEVVALLYAIYQKQNDEIQNHNDGSCGIARDISCTTLAIPMTIHDQDFYKSYDEHEVVVTSRILNKPFYVS